MTPDIYPHVEKMDAIVGTREMIGGVPQRTNRGTGGRHKVVGDRIPPNISERTLTKA